MFVRETRGQGSCGFLHKYVSLKSANVRTPMLIHSSPGITEIEIEHCECKHPAVALLERGAFTSTPVKPPKWAFDLCYLSYVREQFLANVPNFTGWCAATVAFFAKEGASHLPTAVKSSMFSFYMHNHADTLRNRALCCDLCRRPFNTISLCGIESNTLRRGYFMP